jgi:transcriptional regulator with XRE-family HTH domain
MILSEVSNGGAAGSEKTPGARIRTTRMARRWSLQRLALEMRRQAKARGEPAPSVGSLKSMISRWEHDVQVPHEYNRRLLAAALEVTVKELGLTTDPDFVW